MSFPAGQRGTSVARRADPASFDIPAGHQSTRRAVWPLLQCIPQRGCTPRSWQSWLRRLPSGYRTLIEGCRLTARSRDGCDAYTERDDLASADARWTRLAQQDMHLVQPHLMPGQSHTYTLLDYNGVYADIDERYRCASALPTVPHGSSDEGRHTATAVPRVNQSRPFRHVR